MDHLLFFAYEAAASFLPLAVVLLLLRRTQTARPPARSNGWLALLALYLLGVFHVTGIGTLYDLLRYSLVSTGDVNLVPFAEGISVSGGLNVILFVPFGFLVPMLFAGQEKWHHLALSGAALSLVIELSQLLNARRTDVEDLLLNTLGALLGYGLYRLVRLLPGRDREPEKRREWELAVCAGVMLLGRFLLFDEFGLAKLLYQIG